MCRHHQIFFCFLQTLKCTPPGTAAEGHSLECGNGGTRPPRMEGISNQQPRSWSQPRTQEARQTAGGAGWSSLAPLSSTPSWRGWPSLTSPSMNPFGNTSKHLQAKPCLWVPCCMGVIKLSVSLNFICPINTILVKLLSLFLNFGNITDMFDRSYVLCCV